MSVVSLGPVELHSRAHDRKVDRNEGSMSPCVARASRITLQGAQLDDRKVDRNEGSMSPLCRSGQ